jgi:hypothetical protein
MAQAVECLLLEHEALNSNPSPTKKKRKEKKNEGRRHGSSGRAPA